MMPAVSGVPALATCEEAVASSQAVAFQGVATIAGSSSFQGAASSFREAVIRGESLVAFLDGPMAA